MGLNLVQIIGNLGQEPEMRFIPSGSPVTSFRVAASRRWYDKSGDLVEDTEWVNVVVWGKAAENCNQYLRKGSLVYVQGRLATRSWDAQDGTKRYKTEVIAFTVQFLDRKGMETVETTELESTDSGELAEKAVEAHRASESKKSAAAASSTKRKVVKRASK